MDAHLLAASPAIQVNVGVLASYLILVAISLSLFTVVGILVSNKRKLSELWEVHLGTRAIGPDGMPRWYIREEAITDAIGRVEKTLETFADSHRELIQELRLDRAERRALANAKASRHNPGAKK